MTYDLFSLRSLWPSSVRFCMIFPIWYTDVGSLFTPVWRPFSFPLHFSPDLSTPIPFYEWDLSNLIYNTLWFMIFSFRFGMTSHSIVCYDPFPPIFTSSFQYDPSSALRSLQYSLLDDLALFPPSSTISLRSDLYLLSSISFVLRFRSLHFPVCYWPFHSVLDLFKILSVLWRIISFFQVCYDLFTPVGHDLFPILTLSL